MQELQQTQVPSLGQEYPLEEGLAIYSSVLTWKIPWTEEPGGLQPIGHKDSDMTEATQHACRTLDLGSSTLAWKIPWMEEPGGGQSMGLQRVGHD